MENDCIEQNMDEVLAALDKFIKSAGGKGAAAAKLGISRVYLWRMANGNRPFSDAVLEAIGFERVVKTVNEYKRIKQ